MYIIDYIEQNNTVFIEMMKPECDRWKIANSNFEIKYTTEEEFKIYLVGHGFSSFVTFIKSKEQLIHFLLGCELI